MKVQVLSIVMSGFLQLFQCGEPGLFSINSLLQTFAFFLDRLDQLHRACIFNKFTITEWFAVFSNVLKPRATLQCMVGYSRRASQNPFRGRIRPAGRGVKCVFRLGLYEKENIIKFCLRVIDFKNYGRIRRIGPESVWDRECVQLENNSYVHQLQMHATYALCSHILLRTQIKNKEPVGVSSNYASSIATKTATPALP
ncbi:hypothetical protein RRG08_038536 [Elysia crispata]|uniref:Uncharacterized protein n=1 Tax=Elysia crispata TaxID=231223 RepID=A0AAE1B3L8_9GAST|nr:hypothetical protein RRG08_038536 [Elysia crispata]